MDRQKRNPIIGQNPKLLRLEKRQAADVINVVSGFELNYPEGKGTVNMCLAIQEMRKESKIEGAVLTCKALGISLDKTIKQITEMFQLSESEASETVKLYW
nr:hypothetical protein [uncultured Acetatifactor sp.]